MDRALFFASTVISIGDGRNTSFWEGRWLHGAAPKELAPHLYDQARCKFRTVHKELQNMNWIKNLKQINSETLIDEFILLFTFLNDISMRKRIQLFGNGRDQASTPQPPLMKFSFSAPPPHSKLLQSGKPTLNLNVASSPG
jgi:hypothetical protein